MAVTLAQFRTTYGDTSSLTDQRLQQALDGAAALVARQHGPEAPPAGQLLRCTWDLRYRREPRLDCGRQMAAARRVQENGVTLPDNRYRLRGRVLEAPIVSFGYTLVGDFEPAADTPDRDGMVADLAAVRLGLATAPKMTPGQILRRVALSGATFPLPIRIETVSGGQE